MKKLFRHIGICVLMTVAAVLAFASKGGGGEKKNSLPFNDKFSPITASGTFTLRNGYSYNGSYIFNSEKTDKSVSFNAMIAYQKGNNIYLMPFKYKVDMSAFSSKDKTNLQFLGVKIQMSK